MENLKIRIFLSSTFSGSMLIARDAFRNELLAKLNAIAGQIRSNVYLNDFELGIPDGTEPLSVICTCLDSIVASDYFIGVLGDDRGTLLSTYLQDSNWCESRYSSLIEQAIQSNFTVLELEFLCAVQSGHKSFFYLDTERRIGDNYDKSIENYLLLHNQRITGFSSLEELKRSVVNDLEAEWNLCYCAFANYSQQEKDVNIVLANKFRYYVPNVSCVKRIEDYVRSDSNQVLWIVGKEGWQGYQVRRRAAPSQGR